MSWIKQLFHKEEVHPQVETATVQPPDEGWQDLPAYIATDKESYQLVSAIATAIAVGDRPEGKYRITKIVERNPEAELVSVIAASLAAESYPESKFRITHIMKKKETNEHDA